MRRRFLGILLLAAGLAVAQPVPARATRILFVGNSLTYTGELPARLSRLAGDMGKPAEVDSVAFSDFSLADHWSDGRALAAIRKGGWDVVVLQQGTSARDDSRDELVEFARRFAAEIRKAGAKPALYMTWPTQDRARDFPAAIQSWRFAATSVDALLLPVGEAWLRTIMKDKRTRLYSDSLHPSSLGVDLAAITIYLSLFPAGPEEFTEDYIRRIEKSLGMPPRYTDAFVDAATRAIDEPIAVK